MGRAWQRFRAWLNSPDWLTLVECNHALTVAEAEIAALRAERDLWQRRYAEIATAGWEP